MSDEQLFVEEPEFLNKINVGNNSIVIVDNNTTNPNLATFCSCEQQAGSTESLDDINRITCNLTDSHEECLDSSSSSGSYVQYESCLQPLRRRRSVNFPHKISKRSLGNDDDVVDFQPLTYSDEVNETKTEVILICRLNLFHLYEEKKTIYKRINKPMMNYSHKVKRFYRLFKKFLNMFNLKEGKHIAL